MHTKIHLQLDERRLTLRRYPLRQQEKLQAWDGADRYMLHHRMKHFLPPLMIVNEDFGALALAAGEGAHHWNDSWLAKLSWQQNAKANQQQALDDHWHWPLDVLPQVQEVWLKVPKELALLTYQLHRLTAELAVGTPIYLAWVDKHAPASLVDVARKYLADVDLMPGRFKAHGLVGYARGEAAAPLDYPTRVAVPQLGAELVTHAGVFAQHQLDIGTRFMLEHLPDMKDKFIVDLACGSGVLGLVAATQNPTSQLCFADESYLALASAKANWQHLFPQQHAEFFHGNGLAGWQGKADIVLLNPPFHQGHTVDTTLASAMFAQAARALSPQGELWVVANKHLAYDVRLKRFFHHVTEQAEHPKFVLLCAREPKLSKRKKR